jgi:ferritin-like metal-binding protein YciE
MSETATASELLKTCLQDLHAGRTQLTERLPGSAAHARDAGLGQQLSALVTSARDEARAMEEICDDLAGPENLWMAGMLDDVERDTRSIAAGPLLDIAIIGAVRKMLAADIVSLETAIALADRLNRSELAGLLRNCRSLASSLDALLVDNLEQLAISVS